MKEVYISKDQITILRGGLNLQRNHARKVLANHRTSPNNGDMTEEGFKKEQELHGIMQKEINSLDAYLKKAESFADVDIGGEG